MKKYFIAEFILLLPLFVTAQVTPTGNIVRPTSEVGTVTRPTTAVGNVFRPKTEGGVSKPVTLQNNVVKPMTDVGTVVRPTTTVSVSRPTTEGGAEQSPASGNTAGAKSATPSATSSSSSSAGKAPGTGSFSSFEAKDLKAASTNPNMGGLSKTREDAPSNGLLDAARNKVDLSGDANAIAKSVNISESSLSKSVVNAVTKDGSKKKK